MSTVLAVFNAFILRHVLFS